MRIILLIRMISGDIERVRPIHDDYVDEDPDVENDGEDDIDDEFDLWRH